MILLDFLPRQSFILWRQLYFFLVCYILFPFIVFFLENPMEQRAWWATTHGVAKNRTQLKWLKARTQWTTIIDFCMLNQAFIPGINPTWPWCIILFINCWIKLIDTLLGIFASIHERYWSVGLFSFSNMFPCFLLLLEY